MLHLHFIEGVSSIRVPPNKPFICIVRLVRTITTRCYDERLNILEQGPRRAMPKIKMSNGLGVMTWNDNGLLYHQQE